MPTKKSAVMPQRVHGRFLIAGFMAALPFMPSPLGGQSQPALAKAQEPVPQNSLAEGIRIFESRCASCHGLDGRGGERAPDIAQRISVQRRPDGELFRIVRDGIPGTGMPAFGSLGETPIRNVVAYLRKLQGKDHLQGTVGDAKRGKAIFYGKAGCASCHLVRGEGGFLAGDLTAFAQGRSENEIRAAIVSPEKYAPLRSGKVTVTTHNGGTYSGVLRNEDNFSLQMQSPDGAFHLFLKSDLRGITRSPEPLMPKDYGSRLSAEEINDLISFLANSAQSSGPPDADHSEGHEEEDN